MGKMHLTTVLVLLLIALLTGCGAKEKPADMSLFGSGKIVGKDIPTSDITDFYYTEETSIMTRTISGTGFLLRTGSICSSMRPGNAGMITVPVRKMTPP